MSEIHCLNGDATLPQGDGPKIIVHICNDIGGWGRGFVLALSRRDLQPERAYKKWFAERVTNDFGLGAVQFVEIADEIWVANLIGQHNIVRKGDTGLPPVRYGAIESGLEKVAGKARELGASVHMPRIGCGVAGGKWKKVEPLIQTQLCQRAIEVWVYDLQSGAD